MSCIGPYSEDFIDKDKLHIYDLPLTGELRRRAIACMETLKRPPLERETSLICIYNERGKRMRPKSEGNNASEEEPRESPMSPFR